MANPTLKAPFPYFGVKSKVAGIVWSRFGDVPNYVEPFAGSLAVLLGRPTEPKVETVNDKDGFLCNFWRAVKNDPEQVAFHADNPVNENDLHARHFWLVDKGTPIVSRLEGDPDFYDCKIAGWWVWGLCSKIGGGWCSGKGPWSVVEGELIAKDRGTNQGAGIIRSIPHLGNAGRGVNKRSTDIKGLFGSLSDRLRSVRVCCGDWKRVVGQSITTGMGITGMFLDPPYSHDLTDKVYRIEQDISTDVRNWAVDHGDDPKMRIAFCGYEGEHEMPETWTVVAWKANGGYGVQANNRARTNSSLERIWFSPHCLAPTDV